MLKKEVAEKIHKYNRQRQELDEIASMFQRKSKLTYLYWLLTIMVIFMFTATAIIIYKLEPIHITNRVETIREPTINNITKVVYNQPNITASCIKIKNPNSTEYSLRCFEE